MDGSNLTLIGSSTASYFVRGIDLDPFRRELFYSSLSVFRRHYLDSGVISILGGQNFMGGYPSYLGLYLPTNKLLWLRQFADPGPPDRLDRANLDSNNIESLVTGSYDRFAVDPVHHWVFIIGANSSIVRISLHTLDTVDLMTVPSTEALAVDPFSGKVYWTEPDEGRIMRMDLDGQNAEIVVSGQSAPEIVAVFNPIDCDGNSVSDWCDISCGLPGGPCNVPGCGGGLTVTATVFLIPAKLSPIAI
jgi:hypothetical protein